MKKLIPFTIGVMLFGSLSLFAFFDGKATKATKSASNARNVGRTHKPILDKDAKTKATKK